MKVGSATAFTLRDEDGDPVEELSSGTVTALNTYGAQGLASRLTSASAFYLYDVQGSVTARLDGSHMVSSQDWYDGWGNRQAGSTTDPVAFGGQMGYTTDHENGLVLLGHRYYDPTRGAFLNRDPIGYNGGINLYAYAGDNPVNGVDPSGLATDSLTSNVIASLGSGDIEEAIGLVQQGAGGFSRSAINSASLRILNNSTVQRAILRGLGGLAGVSNIPGTVQTAAGKLPECSVYAERVFNILEKLGGDNEELPLEIYKAEPIATRFMPLVKNGGSFANHFYVKWGDIIIDSLTGPNGQPYEMWLKRWEYVKNASDFINFYHPQLIK